MSNRPPKGAMKAVRIGSRINKTSAFKTGQTTRIRRNDAYTIDWFAISRAVKQRDRNQCRKCPSTENLEVHHIVPVSKGGTNNQSNLITLCHSCHKKQPRHGHMK